MSFDVTEKTADGDYITVDINRPVYAPLNLVNYSERKYICKCAGQKGHAFPVFMT